MPDALEDLKSYCFGMGRVVPYPARWNELWELLPERSRIEGNGWQPPLPLILSAWYETSENEKRERLALQLEWAHSHGALGDAEQFLRHLPEFEWLHDSHAPMPEHFYEAQRTAYFMGRQHEKEDQRQRSKSIRERTQEERVVKRRGIGLDQEQLLSFENATFIVDYDPPLELRIDEANQNLRSLFREKGIDSAAVIPFVPPTQPQILFEPGRIELESVRRALEGRHFDIIRCNMLCSDNRQLPAVIIFGLSRKFASAVTRNLGLDAFLWTGLEAKLDVAVAR